ncbi:MAG: hypothetical protein M1825_004709 [Sarcosagium campestre]|nr:MAG: hypothetical protein M1825_004709 [Sarcosagium campestre]
MDELSSSPGTSAHGRIPRPQGFLPLSQDEMFSTRGLALPALIHSQSSAALHQSRRPRSVRSDYGDEEAGREIDGLTRSDDESIGRITRRSSNGAEVLMTPKMRSMRLIGNSNPRYQWEKYIKPKEQLKPMKKSIRQYYERTNALVEEYMYIDRLLDSSLPHDLIQEYNDPHIDIPRTINEEPPSPKDDPDQLSTSLDRVVDNGYNNKVKVKRTPRNLYRIPNEDTPLIEDTADEASPLRRGTSDEDDNDDGGNREATIVKVAININVIANALLLAGKAIVIFLTNSLSVLASLVDAVLDFLSTAIIWTTSKIMARQDQYAYPVGRRRLEPIGVLVFSVIMITSFFQVLLQSFSRLNSGDHTVVQLTLPAIIIMSATVVVKFACWLWCRLIKNSSVQALAQDAMTDVVFNTFSIIFPLVGYWLQIWWLDALGGALLSIYVIVNWSSTAAAHIRNLTGAAASADERNFLLYLTMRFAKTIKKIQGLQAYHSGDGLTVECDIVLDQSTSLRDSHDLGESLQYVIESVPWVDRAFVHLDYQVYGYLPTHMSQTE